MEELEQWKEQFSHLSNLAMDRLREVPPNQLYVAAAIAIFTTLLLFSGEFALSSNSYSSNRSIVFIVGLCL